jgi:hypothetical protein
MKIPSRTETGDSTARLKSAHELNAQIEQNMAEIKKAFANITKADLPPDWVDQSGFEQFIKSRGIILTEADEIALLGLCTFFDAGAVLSPVTILKFLRQFNPARQLAEGA